MIEPVDEEHMYFAAMNSKACKLTALGLNCLVPDVKIRVNADGRLLLEEVSV